MFRLTDPSPIPNPVNANPPDLTWLGPTITAIGTIVVVVIVGINALLAQLQKHREALVEKAVDGEIAVQPKITDGWEEVRRARAEATAYYNLYRTFEDLFYRSVSALRHLARSFREKLPNDKLDQDVVDALAIVPPDTISVDASK